MRGYIRLFHVPYKWHRRPLENLSHIYWDIRSGLRNLVHYFPAVWKMRAWDYTGLLRLMETAMLDMAACQDSGHLARADVYAQQLRVAAALCRRIRDDNYVENEPEWRRNDGLSKPAFWAQVEARRKSDQAYLALLIEKYLTHWWD